MKTILLFILIAYFSIPSVFGQGTLVAWSFNGTTAGSVQTAAHLTASNVTGGSVIGSTAFNGSEWYGQDGWPAAAAVDANAYMQFTVTAISGYSLILNTVNMTIRRSTTGTAAGSGPQSWSIRSSLDNYATDLLTGTLTLNYATVAVSLPSSYQQLLSTVTFRLYGYNQVTTSGGFNRLVTDNFNIQGQTPSGVLAEQSLALSAVPVSSGVSLRWEGVGMAAGTEYTIERSTDGTDFSEIEETAGANFQDRWTAGAAQVYYRVKAQQPDGAVSWSETVVVSTADSAAGMAGVAGAEVRSVAVEGGLLRLRVGMGRAGVYQVSIFSTNGQLVWRQEMPEQAGEVVKDIAFGSRPHGVYVLHVAGDGGQATREFLY
jgi:hypothetical protein